MSTTHRIITGAALALATSATPGLARPFDLNANGSYVPAGATASSTPIPPVLPATKASQLATLEQAKRQAAAYAPASGSQYSNAETDAYRYAHTPSGVATVATPQPEFAWGDAGIGAAAGIVLAMLGLAGAVGVSRHRARRTHRATA